jgi:hypothetical protein
LRQTAPAASAATVWKTGSIGAGEDRADALDDASHRLAHVGLGHCLANHGCIGGGSASSPRTVRSSTAWSNSSLVWNVK